MITLGCDFTPLHRPKHSEVRSQHSELIPKNLRIILFALVVSSKLQPFTGSKVQGPGLNDEGLKAEKAEARCSRNINIH